MPFSPNQITIVNFLTSNLAATYFFSRGTYKDNLRGLFFCAISAISDWMDGMIARKRGLSSKGGAFLDPTLDFVWQNLLVAGIVFGVFINKNQNLFWLATGLLALVSMVMANYLTSVYSDNFGFSFRGEYGAITKKVDSSKRVDIFDKLCLEMLIYRKFSFIFLFTIRYPLLLGALFDRLDLFLILLLFTSLFKVISLFYLYFLFLEADKKKENRVIIEALRHRHRSWLREKG
ncbi:MAG: CDP-alcohol phosphatidyltransferase family protein, partial [Deltaproteobacteria bacterium]|nr:CDP-alcohol phosphatidyltransferase family protein [Deltaproteobacteria bacterium]